MCPILRCRYSRLFGQTRIDIGRQISSAIRDSEITFVLHFRANRVDNARSLANDAGSSAAAIYWRGPLRLPRLKSDSRCKSPPSKCSTNTFISVTTDERMVGHGSQRLAAHVVEDVVKPALVGKDSFAIERLLQIGLLKWPGMEHALWDIVENQPDCPRTNCSVGIRKGSRST